MYLSFFVFLFVVTVLTMQFLPVMANISTQGISATGILSGIGAISIRSEGFSLMRALSRHFSPDLLPARGVSHHVQRELNTRCFTPDITCCIQFHSYLAISGFSLSFFTKVTFVFRLTSRLYASCVLLYRANTLRSARIDPYGAEVIRSFSGVI